MSRLSCASDVAREPETRAPIQCIRRGMAVRQGFVPICDEPKANRDATESASPLRMRSKTEWVGGEAGIRTLRASISKLVMARDFWL